ncbi:MAG: ANTAR domain-containing protein [Streptosporangiaceae bacterium]
MLSFRLFTHENVLGALNLYAHDSGAFDDRSHQVGMIFASHAAVGLVAALTEANLRQAIRTRQTIGEAIGILMERHKYPAEGAFDRLRRASQEGNIKLRDLAARVVEWDRGACGAHRRLTRHTAFHAEPGPNQLSAMVVHDGETGGTLPSEPQR